MNGTLFASVILNQKDPLWVYVAVLGGLGLTGFLIRFLDRRYPSKKNFRGSIGKALMRAEAGFLPGREHIAEAMEHEEASEDAQGEPPETGG